MLKTLGELGSERMSELEGCFSPNVSISRKGSNSWGFLFDNRTTCSCWLCASMEMVRAFSHVVPVLGKEARSMSEGRGLKWFSMAIAALTYSGLNQNPLKRMRGESTHHFTFGFGRSLSEKEKLLGSAMDRR